jgi:hypothetical protein
MTAIQASKKKLTDLFLAPQTLGASSTPKADSDQRLAHLRSLLGQGLSSPKQEEQEEANKTVANWLQSLYSCRDVDLGSEAMTEEALSMNLFGVGCHPAAFSDSGYATAIEVVQKPPDDLNNIHLSVSDDQDSMQLIKTDGCANTTHSSPIHNVGSDHEQQCLTIVNSPSPAAHDYPDLGKDFHLESHLSGSSAHIDELFANDGSSEERPSQSSKIKTVMTQRLMHQYKLMTAVNSRVISHAGEGETGGSGLSRSSATPSTGTRNQDRRKRKNRDSSLPPNDGNQGGKRKKVSSADDAMSKDEERLACLYFKRNPRRYRQEQACTGPGFLDAKALK